MKKLLAGILASTMVAGMSVSAFAYADATGATVAGGITTADADFVLQDKAYIDGAEATVGQQLKGGEKIYYPILCVDENDTTNFKYANRASEVEDLRVNIDAVNGGKYIKDATIVREDIAAVSAEKIYYVEVELNDYFGTTDTEIDFELSLKTRTVEYDSEDQDGDAAMAFILGEESAKLSEGDSIVKRFRNGELTLVIDENTGSVRLDEMDNGEAIEHIFIECDDVPFTFDVKASDQDDLYLEVNDKADKEITIANPDAKLSFVNFPGQPEFDFTGTAQFSVEDPEVDYYLYEIVDGKLVNTTAKYNEEDETLDLRTRTLGSYVISDKELDTTTEETVDPEDKPTTVDPTNPDKEVPTGALV